MKIGIFGGTFDPVHIGHLLSAEHVRERLQLDKVLFIPAKNPPNKQGKSITEAKHRLRMLQLSIEDNPYFEVSDMEIHADDPVSYTWITIKRIRERYLHAELFLLLGADTVYDLQNWQQVDFIISHCTLVGFARPGERPLNRTDALEADRKILLIDTPQIEISSSDIRERLSQGMSVKYMVKQHALDYMKENFLYGQMERVD